jgi:hypothetical protein
VSTGSLRQRFTVGSGILGDGDGDGDGAEAQRPKQYEDENRRLKLVAELSLHGEVLKSVITRNCAELAGLRKDVA